MMMMKLKPSRRPRFNPSASEMAQAEAGRRSCDLRINSFYGAPIGKEDWRIKHIVPKRSTSIQQKPQPVVYKLPVMKPTVKPAAPRYVGKVMRNHFRTQELLSNSSYRAERVVNRSQITIREAQ